jgi:hypothetical protein
MPKLNRTYDTREAIPADIYVEKDGKFVLNSDLSVEGYVPSTTLEEFRNNNIKLQKDLAKFEGIDPEKATTLIAKEKEILDAEAKGAERIKERVDERTKDALDKFNKDRERLEGENTKLRSELTRTKIEAKALELATPFGLRKDAAENLRLTVNAQWVLDENGEPIVYEPGTKSAKLDEDGKPMRGTDGLARFIEKLAKEKAKFLFVPNSGGDAHNEGNGERGGGDDGGYNPFDPKIDNRTAQTKLVKTDYPKAVRLAAKFGITLPPKTTATMPV